MTTRRGFLAQAGLMTAGALIAPEFLSAKGKAVAGLQLYTLREQLPKDVKGVIAKVAAAGYKEVETFGYSKENGFWGLSAPEFSKLLKSHGLTSPSGHYGVNALFENGSLSEIDDAIEAAKALGQTYVVVPYIDQKFRGDLDNIVQKVNLAAQHVKKAGLKLGYHNHDFEFKEDGGKMLYTALLKGTTAASVTLEMDLYWVVRAGQDPIEWMTKYPGRFRLVHVKDMDKADRTLNTEVGSGSIDYKKIIAKARKSGVDHFIVEQENFKIDPYVSIAQSARYLKTKLLA
ncbi:sugar phosphate isomerase/epimerase [Mucilaginibacter sp. RS28]|uniref:Sugar phosphate isomerase/epimerase n=1 Tax=Mucilaginibacter straminoryzae TaxID=2932774 RepID=A0A9X1X4U7_9SPHI|nr:sugar phosphate isomerase/epimerase [Mucilaginibacter straminoryzae]MCJ8210953.1 sugar phosphate isomerase/epimerase [Mucilaginibacter straminoryzae]